MSIELRTIVAPEAITMSGSRRIILLEAHKGGKLLCGENLLRMRRCIGCVFDSLAFSLSVGILAALIPSWSLVHGGGIDIVSEFCVFHRAEQ